MTRSHIPSEALEGLMNKVFMEGQISPGMFWEALLNANLYVPLSKSEQSKKTGKSVAKEGEKFPMLLGVDSKGKHVVWLFTSAAALTTYTEQNLPYLEVPTKQIFSKLVGNKHDIFLIGQDRLTLELHPNLLASLAKGQVPEGADEKVRHIPKDSKVYVGPPEEDTAELEERFIRLFDDTPDVCEAALMQFADESGSRLLLGLRLKKNLREELKKVSQSLAKAAEGILERGKYMDITLLDGSLKEAFKKHGKRFFER